MNSKRCRICSFAQKKNCVPKTYIKLNWTGSAMAMEPAMACEMVQNILYQGERVCMH